MSAKIVNIALNLISLGTQVSSNTNEETVSPVRKVEAVFTLILLVFDTGSDFFVAIDLLLKCVYYKNNPIWSFFKVDRSVGISQNMDGQCPPGSCITILKG